MKYNAFVQQRHTERRPVPQCLNRLLEFIVMCNSEHEPKTKCTGCGEDVDAYGNTESDFRECSFPDCGCYGARNCMAPSGANYASNTLNIEKGRKPIHYEDLGT